MAQSAAEVDEQVWCSKLPTYSPITLAVGSCKEHFEHVTVHPL